MDVSEALKMLEEYKSHWNQIYEEAREDLKFLIDKNQWKNNDRTARELAGRPCISVNVLPQQRVDSQD